MSTRRVNSGFHYAYLFDKPNIPLCRNDYHHTCKTCGIEFVDQTWISKRCTACRKKATK